MPRNDARLIAEELFKIQKREGLVETEVIGIEEVAEILGGLYHLKRREFSTPQVTYNTDNV